jgi:hypothetical protein
MSFLAVFFLAAAFCNALEPAQAARPDRPDPVEKWDIKGDPMTTDDEAVQDALDKAQAKLNDYLRAQKPPMSWQIDRGYLQQKLLSPLKADEKTLKDLGWKKEQVREVPLNGQSVLIETEDFPGLGAMRRAALRVEVRPEHQKEFRDQEDLYQAKLRNDRATSRQWWLVRILTGLVAVLVAVTFYLRLEDATKGYYTTLLRAAALAFVVLVGAGLWLLT